MHHIPDNFVALALISPPYCAEKACDKYVSLKEHLSLIANVGNEVFRCLIPDRRYAINVVGVEGDGKA